MSNRKNENTVKTDLFKISPHDIVVSEGFNSRRNFDLDELVKSISENGVLNPISVVPYLNEEGVEKYRLVDGERRYRATMEAIKNGADIKRVPAIFLSKSLQEDELIFQQILRNEGKPFSEYEYGIAFRNLKERGYTIEEILKKLGMPAWKAIYLTHTERDPRVQKLMSEGKIEGVTVRHIYQAHKNDEEGAVQEILNASTQVGKVKDEKTGKKVEKITLDTLRKLDANSKTIAKKDSEKILAGLRLLIRYTQSYKGTGVEALLSIDDIYSKLSKGETIVEILDGLMKQLKAVD